MKHVYLILVLFLSTGIYAQQKETDRVERTPTLLQGATVPVEKRTTHTETTASDPNGQTRYYVFDRETQQTIELTKAEKLAEIDQKIQSAEGKLLLLNDDPVANEVEIGEKLQYLQQLQEEKEALKNEQP
jgi:hypothetical protein